MRCVLKAFGAQHLLQFHHFVGFVALSGCVFGIDDVLLWRKFYIEVMLLLRGSSEENTYENP